MQQLMDLAIAIGYFCDTQHALKWAKQNKQPYYFLVFDESTKKITIKRWGHSKRPLSTDGNLWKRIEVIIPQSYESKIYAVLNDWSRLWDNIAFDAENSEKVPKIYSNTKFDNNVYFMFEEKRDFVKWI